MNSNPGKLLFRSPIRWLAAAGAAATLMAPLAANADHQSNDLAGIVASAAVAYVVVDAVGGFDNDKHRKHKSDRYHYPVQRGHNRHAFSGHGYDQRHYSRAQRARTEHWRQHAYSSHKRAHRQNHQHDQRRYQNPHRKHQAKQKKHFRAYH